VKISKLGQVRGRPLRGGSSIHDLPFTIYLRGGPMEDSYRLANCKPPSLIFPALNITSAEASRYTQPEFGGEAEE
jgi:hypothetical protein